MGRCGRKRSVSGGSHKDMSDAIGLVAVESGSTAAAASARACCSNSNNQLRAVAASRDLLETLLQLENSVTGRYFLHDVCFEKHSNSQPADQQQQHDYSNAENNSLLSLAAGLLTRAQQVDHHHHSAVFLSHRNSSSGYFLRRFLLQRDAESGYTPLHAAMQSGNLAYILLFLRTALSASSSSCLHYSDHPEDEHLQPRLTQRPMLMLHQVGLGSQNSAAAAAASTTGSNNHKSAKAGSSLSLLHAMVTAVDNEGFTAADLLAALQRKHLWQCRLSLPRAKIVPFESGGGSRRRSSFDLAENDGNEDGEQQNQNEFDVLSRHLPVLPQQVSDNMLNDNINNNSIIDNATTFGCEVITFGLDHHCALGVGATTSNSSTTTTTTTTTTASSSSAGGKINTSAVHLIRPQRVQALAPRPGQKQGAVAVAASAHHTLVVMGRCSNGQNNSKNDSGGHLYAFGLGRGGRLGTGHETPCPTPTRILGPLQGRVVIGVAAAENHSLCVTQCGNVYAWGSNRFGQVGIATTTGGVGSTSSSNDGSHSMRLLPRRVDDLKQVHCVAVAAGEKHSVALSNKGQVYVWGDNTAGQLGICRRSGVHKVQRVLDNKACIAIAASEQATLVLAIPDSSRGRRGALSLPVNSVYSWGHGNHVPSKVHFERGTAAAAAKTTFSTKPTRPINPVAIACARYHSVAITSDGEVYTWGLHAEPLGTKSKKLQQSASSSHPNNSASLIVASPQLVKGMLPGNGGGIAVAVSACENHTAVLTDTGALYTWGSTDGKNILGHEGVSWQPDPKKVPGVHRAVGVAVAKEHTVLLVATVFPPITEAAKAKATAASTSPQPTTATQPLLSLEDLAARKAAEYVDLFNVLSVLITAERANCPFLVDYCMEFCRCNLDGVLNVGEKSVLNTYLKEQLMSSLLARPLPENRYAHLHPLLNSVVTSSTPRCQDKDKNIPVFVLEQCSRLSTFQEWLQGCESLVQELHVANMILQGRHLLQKNSTSRTVPRVRFHSSSPLAQSLHKRVSTAAVTPSVGPRAIFGTSEEIFAEMSLLKNMDLSNMTQAKAEAQQLSLTREVRGIRKRIGQITRLQEELDGSVLSTEQREKIARRPQLETYLQALEPALASVDKKLLEFVKAEPVKLPTTALTVPGNDIALEKDGEKKEEDAICIPGSAKSLRCDVCGITCPDKKSHTLHLNGRKHRNRVALVQEEEQRKAATLMMEEQQRQLLVGPITRSEENPRKNVGDHYPWGAPSVQNKKSATPAVKYTLPPPPHRTPESLVTPTKQDPQRYPTKADKPSLLDIMAEEKSRNSTVRKPSPRTPTLVVVSKSSPAKIPSFHLSLPAGSAPPLKSPPWAQKPAPAASLNSLSLGDFVAVEQPKPAVSDRLRSNSGTSWGSPKPAPSSTVPGTPNGGVAKVAAKSLVEIQQQEQDFQEKEDQTFASNGKWFIERRERAHSFRDIENNANKEREDRLFLEEQFRIESMIRAENEKAKIEEQAEKSSRRRGSAGVKGDGSNRNRNNKGRSSNNKDNGHQQRKKKAPLNDTTTTQEKPAGSAKVDT